MLHTDIPTDSAPSAAMPCQAGDRCLQLSEKYPSQGFRHRGSDDSASASSDGRRLPGGPELGNAYPGAVSVPVKIKDYLMEISRLFWYTMASKNREVAF